MLRLGFAIETSRRLLMPSIPATVEQIRTTFMLKRKYPTSLDKKNRKPKSLQAKHFVYNLIEDTNVKSDPDIKVILTSFVEGVGLKNDVVSVRPNFARTHLLLPGLAIYASPDNLETLKASMKESQDNAEHLLHSSRFAELTKRDLSRRVLEVLVNLKNPWTIEKWHVRAAFRRCGFWVPDYAITMGVAGERPISGPNLELEKKIFLVTVKINNLETTPVRCMIRHWSANAEERLPRVEGHLEPPYEPVFEEERKTITELRLPAFYVKRVNKSS